MIKNMKRRSVLIYLGLLLIVSALLLTFYNLAVDLHYGSKAKDTVEEIIEKIEEIKEEVPAFEELKYANLLSYEIDGDYYTGVIEMPTIDITLPVLADASEKSLNIGPGVYVGTPYGSNFVIAAHNRLTFFSKIRDLKIDDLVYFMDAYGNIFEYKVVMHDIIPPENVSEMIDSNFDLSLFTCDFSDTQRVTVRLIKTNEIYK